MRGRPRYRIARDLMNTPLWSGAVGIEDVIDPDLAVPPVICWFTRGGDERLPERVVSLLNDVRKLEALIEAAWQWRKARQGAALIGGRAAERLANAEASLAAASRALDDGA